MAADSSRPPLSCRVSVNMDLVLHPLYPSCHRLCVISLIFRPGLSRWLSVACTDGVVHLQYRWLPHHVNKLIAHRLYRLVAHRFYRQRGGGCRWNRRLSTTTCSRRMGRPSILPFNTGISCITLVRCWCLYIWTSTTINELFVGGVFRQYGPIACGPLIIFWFDIIIIGLF